MRCTGFPEAKRHLRFDIPNAICFVSTEVCNAGWPIMPAAASAEAHSLTQAQLSARLHGSCAMSPKSPGL